MKIEQAIKNSSPLSPGAKTVINLMYTARYVEEFGAKLMKDNDLTLQQFNVLRILRGQKGKPANLSTIQERMIDKSSNTTRLIDKLIQKDLVERRVCEKNRRKIEVFITKEGLKKLDIMNPLVEENNQNIVDVLSAVEIEKLNTLLDKLRQ